MKHDLQIREMRAADIADVSEIERDGNLCGWSERGYSDELERGDSLALLAVVGGEIVGFIVARLMTDGGEAEICNFAVRSEHRRRGFGERLLEEAFKRIAAHAGINIVWLEVRRSNRSAVSFYRRGGFTPAGCRKGFYTNPREDALLFKREIGRIGKPSSGAA